MISIYDWVDQNCTEKEKLSFWYSVKRQETKFKTMQDNGEVIAADPADNNGLVWKFTETYQGHEDDPVWVMFSQKYQAATAEQPA